MTTCVQHHADMRRQSSIANLNAEFADSFRAMLHKRGRKLKTIYTALVILRSLTRFALHRRMTDVDPLPGSKLRKPKPRPQPCWTPLEADEIVGAAPDRYRPYFTCLRETGCRAGEAKYLTWDDIDYEQKLLHIRPKDEWKPKSGDQRKVPMTPKLIEMLQSLPRAGRWVFTAPVTRLHPQAGRQISERRALRALKRVLRHLERVGHLHTFRHTFISQALTSGVPEAVVRDWVGHVDPAVIRLYTHISLEVSQGYLDRFTRGPNTGPRDGDDKQDASRPSDAE